MVHFVWHKWLTAQFAVFVRINNAVGAGKLYLWDGTTISSGGLESVIIWVGGLQDLRVRV